MQTYLKNGYIVSMDQQDTVFDGGGVLVEDDRITAVGKVDPRLVKPDAEVIDLQGRYVLPGFVNTHVHTSQQISRGVGDDVDFICWLHDRMWPFESSMTEEDSYVSTLMTSLELIRSGVTSFAEPGGQFVSGMARGTAESGLRGKLAKSVMDCGGSSPLGGGGPLAAVGHRHAVLPLGGAVVGAGHAGRRPGVAAGDQQAPQGQALPHGGAGPVQAEKRNLEIPQAEGGADALVQQVPGQDVVQFRRGQPALFQGPGQGLLLHGGLGLLPGVLPEEGIRAQQVKMPRQGAVGLEFSADVGIGHHAGGPQQSHRLPAQASGRHKNHLLSIVCRTDA